MRARFTVDDALHVLTDGMAGRSTNAELDCDVAVEVKLNIDGEPYLSISLNDIEFIFVEEK